MTKPIKVPFHGTTLVVVDHNGEPYTPLKPIVEGVGLAWHSQFQKLKANETRWGILVTGIPSKGGKQEAVCIPLRKLAGWLMTLQPSRVKPELRDKIITYQNECDDALWQYWNEGRAERSIPSHAQAAPRAIPSRPEGISAELTTRINRRAWELAQGSYEEYRDRMRRDASIKAELLSPEEWAPAESSVDAMEIIESTANLCEHAAEALRRNGRRLGKLAGRDYDETVERFMSPEQKSDRFR